MILLYNLGGVWSVVESILAWGVVNRGLEEARKRRDERVGLQCVCLAWGCTLILRDYSGGICAVPGFEAWP